MSENHFSICWGRGREGRRTYGKYQLFNGFYFWKLLLLIVPCSMSSLLLIDYSPNLISNYSFYFLWRKTIYFIKHSAAFRKYRLLLKFLQRVVVWLSIFVLSLFQILIKQIPFIQSRTLVYHFDGIIKEKVSVIKYYK